MRVPSSPPSRSPRAGPGLRGRTRRQPLDVILHVGAHRTGTTTLQAFLRQNRDNLARIGVTFWGPPQTRKGLFAGMFRRPESAGQAEAVRARHSAETIMLEQRRLAEAGVRSLIVSEENMLGTMRNNLAQLTLYPDAGARLERFADAFAETAVRVCLVIRSYEDYWASVLAQVIPAGVSAPREDTLARMASQPIRWRQVIEATAQAYPRADLLVWPFETLVGTPERQLAALLGAPVPVGFCNTREWRNASVGRNRLKAVLSARGDIDGARRIAGGTGRYMPFSPQQREALRDQYAEDLAWLRSGADGCARLIASPDVSPGTADRERGVFE